jgi:serine/threonine protein kinase
MENRFKSVKPKFFDDTYKIRKNRKIGIGTFGKVYQAKCRQSGTKYAVKKIQLPEEEHLREQILKEVTTLRICNHENIIRCFHFTTKREAENGKI